MKKVLFLIVVGMVLMLGVIFGASWAKNAWIENAVNAALVESGQTNNAAVLGGLKDCNIKNGIQDTPTGKEVLLECKNDAGQTVNLRAAADKDGKVLIFDKYKFSGVEVL